MIRTRREVEFGGRRSSGIIVVGARIAGTDRPYPINGEGVSAGVFQQTPKAARGQVVGGNIATGLRGSAAGELRHKKVVAKGPEVKRRERHPPGSVQPVTVLQA